MSEDQPYKGPERQADPEAREMIETLDKRLMRMEELVNRASEAVFTHIPKCDARDEKHERWFSRMEERDERTQLHLNEVKATLRTEAIHRDYMKRAQEKNDKFNWAIIAGIGTVLGLIIADWVSKHFT